MNKQQIIMPFVSFLIVALVVGIPLALVQGWKNHRFYIRARSYEIGRTLITETNSTYLTNTESTVLEAIGKFLTTTNHVDSVTLGDAKPPVGDGTATSQIWLVNERHERLAIRLRQEEKDAFRIVGIWHPTTVESK